MLTKKGMEDSYDITEKCIQISDNQSDFKEIILSDKGIMKILTKEEIDIYSLDYHLKNVDYIFKNVLVNNKYTDLVMKKIKFMRERLKFCKGPEPEP